MVKEFDRLAWDNYKELAPKQKIGPGKTIVFAITKHHAARLALSEKEEQDLVNRLNTPEMYFNEDNLRRAYRKPGGTLIDFIKADLIYLKLLDEEESTRELQSRLTGQSGNGNSKLLFPKQADRYRWSKWRFKSGSDLRDFLRDEVFRYMASLVKEEPRIAEYFRDAVLEIVDPNVLKQEYSQRWGNFQRSTSAYKFVDELKIAGEQDNRRNIDEY